MRKNGLWQRLQLIWCETENRHCSDQTKNLYQKVTCIYIPILIFSKATPCHEVTPIE